MPTIRRTVPRSETTRFVSGSRWNATPGTSTRSSQPFRMAGSAHPPRGVHEDQRVGPADELRVAGHRRVEDRRIGVVRPPLLPRTWPAPAPRRRGRRRRRRVPPRRAPPSPPRRARGSGCRGWGARRRRGPARPVIVRGRPVVAGQGPEAADDEVHRGVAGGEVAGAAVRGDRPAEAPYGVQRQHRHATRPNRPAPARPGGGRESGAARAGPERPAAGTVLAGPGTGEAQAPSGCGRERSGRQPLVEGGCGLGRGHDQVPRDVDDHAAAALS